MKAEIEWRLSSLRSETCDCDHWKLDALKLLELLVEQNRTLDERIAKLEAKEEVAE